MSRYHYELKLKIVEGNQTFVTKTSENFSKNAILLNVTIFFPMVLELVVYRGKDLDISSSLLNLL